MNPLLLKAQIQREMLDYPQTVAALERRIHLLRRTLGGIASCATQCACCKMHNDVASHALRRDVNGGVCDEPGCWCVPALEK